MWLIVALVAVVLCQSTTSIAHAHTVSTSSSGGPRGVRRRNGVPRHTTPTVARALKKTEATFDPTATMEPTEELVVEDPQLAAEEELEEEDEGEAAEEIAKAAEKGKDNQDNDNDDGAFKDDGDDKENDDDADADEVDDKEDKDAVDETISPTFAPSIIIAAAEEAINISTTSPTTEETSVLSAKGDKVTSAPTNQLDMDMDTVAPTLAPSMLVIEENPLAADEQGEVENAGKEDESESTTDSTISPSSAPVNQTAPLPVTTTSSSNSTEDPYLVTLDPFYMSVTMSGGTSDDEGFMEVLVNYMESSMANAYEDFESISYGVNTFSETTELPPATPKNENGTSPTATIKPITNVTVHVHSMTAIFSEQRPEPFYAEVTGYMTVLLENPLLLQEYIDAQPNLDVSIHAVELEFDVPDSASSSTTSASSQTTEAKADDDSSGTNVGLIVGASVGCFAALVWVVFLYGVQNHRHIHATAPSS